MSLADHVRTLGRGPGRARSLTREEARDAMVCMLSDEVAPEAVGALLMLLRMKGETAEEIAVSPFIRKSIRSAPTASGEASSESMQIIASRASSRVRERARPGPRPSVRT